MQPHRLWFLAMPIFVGFAAEVVSNKSAVVKNASFLLRSLSSAWSSPPALHIEIYTASRGFLAIARAARLLYYKGIERYTNPAYTSAQRRCAAKTKIAENSRCSKFAYQWKPLTSADRPIAARRTVSYTVHYVYR